MTDREFDRAEESFYNRQLNDYLDRRYGDHHKPERDEDEDRDDE